MRGEKPLMAEQRTTKLNPHMTPGAEIEPGRHWWKTSGPTTRPTPMSACIITMSLSGTAILCC